MRPPAIPSPSAVHPHPTVPPVPCPLHFLPALRRGRRLMTELGTLPQRSISGERYSLVILGRRRPSANQELLYTSLLPSSGPTRLSYLDVGGQLRTPPSRPLSDYGDLESFTPRRGSQAFQSDADDTPSSSYLSRRSSRGLGDLDFGGAYVNRRPLHQEEADGELGGSYGPLVPYNPTEEEAEAPQGLCRSNTVAKLLDKYTNFSPKREFGYRSPDSAWARHVSGKSGSSTPRKSKKKAPQEYDVALELPGSSSSRRRRPNSKERSRSKTPLSSGGKEVALYPLKTQDEDVSPRGLSRRLDLAADVSGGSYLSNHEAPGALEPSRTSRFAGLFATDEGEEYGLSTPPPRRRTTQREAPAAEEEEEELNGLGSFPCRRSGLKERRSARKGTHDPAEMNGRLDGPRERLGRTARHSDFDWTPAGPRTSLAHDPYGRATSEDFSRALGGSYGQLRDPYGLEDPYYQRAPGPTYGYGETYGLSSQQEPYYGRSYDGYAPRGGYPSGLGYGGERETSALGGYDPYRRPAPYVTQQDYGGVAPPQRGPPFGGSSSMSRTLSYIDEEENPPAEGMTPREVERLRIGKLASKYLRNPSPSPGGPPTAPQVGGQRANHTSNSYADEGDIEE